MSSHHTAHDLAFRPQPPPDDDIQFIDPSLLMRSSTNDDALARPSLSETLPTESTADAQRSISQVDVHAEQSEQESNLSATQTQAQGQPAKTQPQTISISRKARRLLGKTEDEIKTLIDDINVIMENDRYTTEEISDFPHLQTLAFETYRHHSPFVEQLNASPRDTSILNTVLKDLQDSLISLVGLSNDITRQLRANAPSTTSQWWKCDDLHKISTGAIGAFRSSKYLTMELGLAGKSCVSCQNRRIQCEPYEKSEIVACANCKARKIGCSFNSEAATQVKVRDA